MTSDPNTKNLLPQSELTQSLQFVTSVGARRADLLLKLGLRTPADVLFYFPSRYEDFTQHVEVANLVVDRLASVIGTVDDIDEQNKEGRHILYVLIRQPSGFLRGIWFNQDYMLNKFRIGQSVQFRGKVSERGGRFQMTHPQVTWIDDLDTFDDQHWLPIYRLTDGINQPQMRDIVNHIVEQYCDSVIEAVPSELQTNRNLCDIGSAIRMIHAPINADELDVARRRLVFQEFLILQLALAMRRHALQSRSVAPKIELTPKIRSRILGRLPFELRASQANALDEIASDMGRAVPMNRLLHGEVGSGKTAVSASAMMLAVAQGFQAVLMAPTEILARQHVNTLKHWLASSRVKIALCTGSLSAAKRRELNTQVAEGDVDIVVGTTAILSDKIKFANLGIAVVDEQHKFGVRQRASLKQAGFDPHYLVMTATPIPRTVTMTLFGDLDVSTLRRESTSSNVKTYLGNEENRDKWWAFFGKKLEQGRQGFVVAPFVNTNSNSDIQSAEALYESLVNGPLEAFRVALLHGQQSAKEKELAMEEFASGEAQVLIATGVIEVGIDVPNATVMTIESAERFGLSQLHQLRGRVGRGQHPGFVTAFPTAGHAEEIDRLTAFVDSNDGFELAQRDLELRGPGNLLSTKQTGFPPLKIADLIRDEEVLMEAKQVAAEIIAADPDLARSDYQRLRKLVVSRYAKVLDISDVG